MKFTAVIVLFASEYESIVWKEKASRCYFHGMNLGWTFDEFSKKKPNHVYKIVLWWPQKGQSRKSVTQN